MTEPKDIADIKPDVPADATAATPELSPGQTIRRARTDAGYAAEDFAAQLKLSRNMLEALENDDYATLREPVYVRGYYRKCAKLLNLPEDELIAAYEKRARPKAPAIPSKIPVVDGGIETRSGGGALRWLIGLIVVAGTFAAVAWYLQQEDTGFTNTLSTDTTPPVVQPLSGPTLGERPADDSLAGGDRSEIDAEDSGGESLDATNEAAPPAATDTLASENAEQGTSGAGPLTLRFEDNSWVRIQDADGRMLLSGLVRKGATHTLDGKPPFALFLGYAPGVSVQYQGRAIDLAPVTRDNNTANLTVPGGA
ncbi:DUF4115 domain-containing protein [Algiphilus sp. W345]|uniref:DUF4115 domain-containing protein n=1 Tax=Banduia mediterranea TaxID=3075609 RepID=A0ABU2WLF3_9GAMM|nr:RodZ domain-containing protein [Algiphilus sp. W345]MDT0498710.1 DUF4115 domain-containing protein [Algiphilus sp. W345]